MDIQTKLVDLCDPNLDHAIYVQCLKLRRDVFISQMGWNLYHYMGCEFDQYDTPAAVHQVALAGSHVVGCMRLMCTDLEQSNVSYMIRDAHLGRIPNLPKGIMETEIQDSKVWEASRLAISAKVPPPKRNLVLLELLRAGIEHVKEQGGTAMLGLMHPVFIKVFKRNGIDAYQYGPITGQRDGDIVVLRLDFEPEAALQPA